MLAGECQGVDRSGPAACVNPKRQGRTGYYRMPAPRIVLCETSIFGKGQKRQPVLVDGDETVCPWCLINRMRNASILTPENAQTGRTVAAGWNCMGVPEDRWHTHRFPVGNLDDLTVERAGSEEGHPAPGDRGYP